MTRIEVSAQTDAVLLEGHVTRYPLKQLAQETVRHTFRDAVIGNELEVTACGEGRLSGEKGSHGDPLEGDSQP